MGSEGLGSHHSTHSTSNETLAQTQNDFLAGKLWVHQRCVRYAPSENDGVDGEC